MNFLKTIRAHLQHRRAVKATINELSRLSNAELNDIGISRGEIYHIAHTSNPKPVVGKNEKTTGFINDNLKGWV